MLFFFFFFVYLCPLERAKLLQKCSARAATTTTVKQQRSSGDGDAERKRKKSKLLRASKLRNCSSADWDLHASKRRICPMREQRRERSNWSASKEWASARESWIKLMPTLRRKRRGGRTGSGSSVKFIEPFRRFVCFYSFIMWFAIVVVVAVAVANWKVYKTTKKKIKKEIWATTNAY